MKLFIVFSPPQTIGEIFKTTKILSLGQNVTIMWEEVNRGGGHVKVLLGSVG